MTKSPQNSPNDERRTKEFIRLLGQSEPALRGYVFSLVPHAADADEIIQETRIRLWEQFDEYDPAKDFGAWSRTVAHYLVLAFREKSSRHRRLMSDQFIERINAHVVAEPRQLSRRHLALRHCMQRLDDLKRKVLQAYYEGQQSTRELAERFGRSYQSLRQMILRARKSLAVCIEETLSEEDQA